MAPVEKDELLNQIDKELHAINTRLKKVLSKTDEVLRETAPETEEPETEEGQDG